LQEEAREKFGLLKAAKEVLSNDAKRTNYNNYLDSKSYFSEVYNPQKVYQPFQSAVSHVTEEHLKWDFYGLFEMDPKDFDSEAMLKKYRKMAFM
jgi:DnaJ-class molecular chaperone